MKKTLLIKKLEALGADKLSEGSSHEKWQGAKGYRFTVPRHNEINERLAQTILKQAKKET